MTSDVAVMHLASFSGNTGDELNHLGFRPWFEELIGVRVTWIEKEIRGYFRGDWYFDETFIEEVNACDLLVIGGGNFFETWPERSTSGTSIDLVVEDYEKIDIPVLVNSIGVDLEQGVSEAARKELPRLLEYMSTHPRRLVSIRNDGAMDAVRVLAGETIASTMIDLPDAGFFITGVTRSVTAPPIIGINLACDMPNIRFVEGDRGRFVEAVAGAVMTLATLHPDIIFRLFPHLYSDYSILSSLMESLPDSLRRERVEVVGHRFHAPLRIAQAYADCSCVISNRFHSAVVPVGMGVPTVGICTYPQISKVFSDLGLADWCLDGLDLESLGSEVVSRVNLAVHSAYDSLPFEECVLKLRARRAIAAASIANWLSEVGLAR